MNLQSVFDYTSPYAYLANTRLPGLDHPVEYLPVDILFVMKQIGNQPSPACPPKARYSGIDAARWAALYQVPFAPNRALFQAMREGRLDNALLVRLAVAAQQAGVFETLHPALFAAVWAGSDDLASTQGREAFLRNLELDADLWQLADSPHVRERLAANNALAIERGVFGVPTFFCDDEMFFGNDRLDFVRAAIAQSKGA
ncbi:2-hydroxychromene-2-carboxylate isomerase [Pseudomonas putida CSV86]|uniref:2-hydroxychromene-2-carboxylate isomerase n=1 Tax=Pseudomonas bharatica CSV86 TaxID=1005395 RepID=L1LYR8_9PSED|nr:2-hydroxychromene-2-carboxylate isomerase [Pseudomonas bharatica]NNJ16027.1 2-hydroxychromene-2-carboxylate isomerase [Pseudomonas bharatica CSV86]